MASYRFSISTGTRIVCAIALCWVVGCKSEAGPAAVNAAPAPSAASADSEKPTTSKEDKGAKTGAAATTTKAAADKSVKAAPTKTAGAATTAGAAKTAAANKKAKFKLTTTATELNIGNKGAAAVTITAMDGYKWNKEYPAKLLFKTAPKNIKLGKTEFKQMSGDFKIGDKKTDIPVNMQATTVGKETVNGVLKFSICNETACIIEKADVALAVNVQP